MQEGLKDCVVWFVSLVPAVPEARLGLPINNRISHFPILTGVGLTLGIMPQHESKTEREREIRTKHIMKEWNLKKKTSTTSCFHETCDHFGEMPWQAVESSLHLTARNKLGPSTSQAQGNKLYQ